MNRSPIERVLEPGVLTAVFQPILDLCGATPRTVAVEGLVRGPRGSNLEAPDVLFEYARRKHREADVDRAAIGTIVAAAANLPAGLRLHVNVHASTLAREGETVEFLARTCAASGIRIERLTLELLERSEPFDEELLRTAVERLRNAGLRLALDDVGTGAANFRMILLSRPSMLKLDRHLVHGVAADPYRQAALRSLRLLADSAGAILVAEGVETVEDLAELQRLRVEQAQGFLFSGPLAADGLQTWLEGWAPAPPVPIDAPPQCGDLVAGGLGQRA